MSQVMMVEIGLLLRLVLIIKQNLATVNYTNRVTYKHWWQ